MTHKTTRKPEQAAPLSKRIIANLLFRPEISATMLLLLTALYILVVSNMTFWSLCAEIFAGRPLNTLLFGGIGFSVILFSLAIPTLPLVQKWALALLVILASVSAFYQDVLGVVIDVDMLQNVVNTTGNEAKHLITVPFVSRVVLLGILPALVISRVRLRPQKLWKQGLIWVLTWLLAFALFLALVFADFKTNSSVIREHKELNWSIQPAAPLAGAFNFVKRLVRTRNIVAEPIALDVAPGAKLGAATKPVFLVIVVGETARAQNFSLNGYGPDTNPELRKRDAIFYHDVSSCGTSTAVSMPCMFSRLPKADYSYQAGKSEENLLDVLARAGFAVEWLDNNTGDLGIAARIPSATLTGGPDVAACALGECNDDVFLAPLKERLAKNSGNTALVLHQIGSHGPSYYLRYPEGFEPFAPACQSSNFADCTSAEIVNAYDNTIAFTDRFLGEVIDTLGAQDRFLTAMVYMSDHGESLGENGLYLHGAPYFLAPPEQTKVPAALWFSDAFSQQMGLDTDCLRKGTDSPISHDNLFSTSLGMLDLETSAAAPALDLTAACKSI